MAARDALRLLHYWWPPVLGWSLALVFARATGRTLNPAGLVALMAGILCAYSLDRAFDRSRRALHGRLHGVLVATGVAAALATGVAATRLPVESAVAVPALGVVAGAYPRLKRMLLVKLVLLPAVWVTAVVALPFPDGSWFAWRSLLQPTVVPIFLLVAAGCLMCDLKDERADAGSGVRSLPALVGSTASARIAGAVALLAIPVALALHGPELAIGGALLGAAATRPDLLASPMSGPLLVDVVLSVPGLLLALGL